MLSKEVLEREAAALRVIGERIKELMASGYEMRIHDNPPAINFEVYLIGPAVKAGDFSDVQTLKIPYAVLLDAMNKDRELKQRFQNLWRHHNDTTRELYAMTRQAMGLLLGGVQKDGGDIGN